MQAQAQAQAKRNKDVFVLLLCTYCRILQTDFSFDITYIEYCKLKERGFSIAYTLRINSMLEIIITNKLFSPAAQSVGKVIFVGRCKYLTSLNHQQLAHR